MIDKEDEIIKPGNVYPYMMDVHLKSAMQLAIDANDKYTAKKLWDIFISYRKKKS